MAQGVRLVEQEGWINGLHVVFDHGTIELGISVPPCWGQYPEKEGGEDGDGFDEKQEQ